MFKVRSLYYLGPTGPTFSFYGKLATLYTHCYTQFSQACSIFTKTLYAFQRRRGMQANSTAAVSTDAEGGQTDAMQPQGKGVLEYDEAYWIWSQISL